MKIDIEYNYLINDKVEKFPSDFCIDQRIYPDNSSKRLYDDIIAAFFYGIETENLEQSYYGKPPFYTIKVTNKNAGKGTLLSSDYIGPSVYWARELGVADSKIIEFLKICRTIGGHITWERGLDTGYYYNYTYNCYKEGKKTVQYIPKFCTVNTSKGGSSGLYDRFDWTLVLLKIYMSNGKKKEVFIEEANNLLMGKNRNNDNVNGKFLSMYYAFLNSEWLKQYSFEEFCKQFNLQNSFVNDKFEIKEMAPLFPFIPKDYEAYIENICCSIDSRNKNLLSDMRLNDI